MIDEHPRLNLAKGEYGSLVPVLPIATPPDHCPRGHDSKVARVSVGYSHLYRAHTVTCRVCHELGYEPATWCLADPAAQATEPTGKGLELVVTPPPARGGVGQLAVHVDNTRLGDVDLMICAACRRGVLEQIRVDQEFRRLGYGRLLVVAALVRAPAEQYRWSATQPADTVEARAFWSRVEFPGPLGEPAYCTDMRIAAGLTPDC